VNKFLQEETKELFGAAFYEISDPMVAADKVCELIEEARENLGINKKAERKLLDMKDRRALNV
jgi:hypothetical protein